MRLSNLAYSLRSDWLILLDMSKKNFDDDFEDLSPEMWSIEDVEFTMPSGRKRNVATLIATSKTDFNLVRYALALRAYVEKIEKELDLMLESEGPH